MNLEVTLQQVKAEARELTAAGASHSRTLEVIAKSHNYCDYNNLRLVHKRPCPTCGSGVGVRCNKIRTGLQSASHEARWATTNSPGLDRSS